MYLQKIHKELWEITTNVAALVCIVILAPSVGCIIGALECGPKVLRHTGIYFQQPLETPGRSTGHAHTLMYTRCPWWHLAAASCCSDPLRQLQPSWKRIHAVFTPLRLTPSCTLRTGHPGWPAASPWRAGTPPDPGASLSWSRSSARRPLSTPGRRWSSDRMELLSVPAGKTPSQRGKDYSQCGGRGGGGMMWDREVPTANTPRTTHPWYCRRVFPYALSGWRNRQNC